MYYYGPRSQKDLKVTNKEWFPSYKLTFVNYASGQLISAKLVSVKDKFRMDWHEMV